MSEANEPKAQLEAVPLDCKVSDPCRVQLKRTKGWKMPPNTVKVDRTTKWGNPFVVGKTGFGYAETVINRRHAWQLFLGAAQANEKLIEAARAELKGKNLACWCPLPGPYEDDECHAAVLLKIANVEVRGEQLAASPTPLQG